MKILGVSFMAKMVCGIYGKNVSTLYVLNITIIAKHHYYYLPHKPLLSQFWGHKTHCFSQYQ